MGNPLIFKNVQWCGGLLTADASDLDKEALIRCLPTIDVSIFRNVSDYFTPEEAPEGVPNDIGIVVTLDWPAACEPIAVASLKDLIRGCLQAEDDEEEVGWNEAVHQIKNKIMNICDELEER